MKRPITLTIAVVLQWVTALVAMVSAFDLIGAALNMSAEGVAEGLTGALQASGINDVDGSLLVVGVFVAGVFVAVLAVVKVVVATYLLQGRSWARLVLSVLIVLSIVSGLAYLVQGYVMRAALVVPVDIVMLWLIFSAPSSEFIKERTVAARDADIAPSAN